MELKRSFLLLAMIGAFSAPLIAQEYWESASSDTVEERPFNFQNMMLSFRGGWSYLAPPMEKGSDDLSDHRKDLSTGLHMSMQAVLFPSRQLGFGINADHFWTKAENEVVLYELNAVRTGLWKQDIVINYIGPAFYGRVLSPDQDLAFLFNLSLGKLFYRNDAVFIDPESWRGWTTGYSFGFSVDHKVARKASLGLSFNHVFGRLNQITVNDGTVKRTVILQGDDVIALSRSDVALGIKWYL